MQTESNLRQYIGPINGAEIIDSTGFDTLTLENVFIKRELTLVLSDGTRAPLANVEYLEFDNNPSGRTKLANSGLDQKLIDAVMLLWGDTAILADPKSVE
jgi:hypothetical protein